MKSSLNEYHRIHSRQFVCAKIGIDGKEPTEIEAEIKKAIAQIADKGGMPIIKIELEGKLKKGSKSIDLDTSSIAKSFARSAIVEIGKPGADSIDEKEIQKAHSLILDGASVKDYGMGIFIDRLKHNNYNMGVGASELFDILSADVTKEKAIKAAMDRIFDKN